MSALDTVAKPRSVSKRMARSRAVAGIGASSSSSFSQRRQSPRAGIGRRGGGEERAVAAQARRLGVVEIAGRDHRQAGVDRRRASTGRVPLGSAWRSQKASRLSAMIRLKVR